MTNEELAKLEPATIRTVSAALQDAIDFRKGRGAMLASLPTPAPKNAQLEQIENALADARNHMALIPANNKLAIGIQKQIIQRYEAQIKELGGDQWLS